MESSVSQAWKGPQTSRVSMFQSGSQLPLAEMTVAEREKLEESSYEVLHSAKDSYHCNVGHSHTACPSAADPCYCNVGHSHTASPSAKDPCYCNVGHSHTASPSAKDPCYSNVGHPPTPSPSASGDNNMAAPLNGSGSEPPPYYNTPKTAHPKPAATSLGDYSYNYVDMSSAIPSAGREIKMEKNVAYFTPGLPQKRN